MEFISKSLSDYCENNTSAETEILAQLNRETHLKVVSPRMLSGHLQGRFLSFISKLQQPKLIVEIGTYTGYSALCLAEGLHPEGKLISIDVNEETSAFAKAFIEKTEYTNKIDLVLADAKDYIPTIKEPIDLVFIDADKKNYLNYYHLVINKLNHIYENTPNQTILGMVLLQRNHTPNPSCQKSKNPKSIHLLARPTSTQFL